MDPTPRANHDPTDPTAGSVRGLAPAEALFDAAYLVARGVRPLALVGLIDESDAEPARAAMQRAIIEGAGDFTVVPFLLRRGPGILDAGFARARWVVDLYAWLHSGAVPDVQMHRIQGLLLGYSSEAIRDFEDAAFVMAAASTRPASGSQVVGNEGTGRRDE